MRIGLIGAGRIGQVHAGVLAGIDAVDEFVITDVAADRARALAERFGATHIERPEDLFGQVDGVVIASSTETHVPYLIRAAEAGISAFCEKPISIDLESTDRAVAAVDASGITVQMGFVRRFDRGYMALHEAIATGRLGEVLLVSGQTHDYEQPPEDYVAVSGGIFPDMLIHEFDVTRYVTASEFVDVTVIGSNHAMPMFDRYDDLATAVVTAHLANGAVAVLSGVRDDAIGYDVRMEVFGTADSVVAGLDAHSPIRTLEPGLDLPQDPVSVDWLDRLGPAFRAEIEFFVGLVANGGDSPCTVRDARAALVVAMACRKAAAEGRTVTIEEIG